MSAGLELAAGFYTQVVRHLVRVPHAAALLGERSEVLGFDDARSADLAWGPRLIIIDRSNASVSAVPVLPAPAAATRLFLGRHWHAGEEIQNGCRSEPGDVRK